MKNIIKMLIITLFLLGSFRELHAEPLKSEDTRSSIEKKFPYRPELKADLDKDEYAKDFNKYCNKFIKIYRSEAIKYTPIYIPYTDDEISSIDENYKETAVKKLKKEFDDRIDNLLTNRLSNIRWLYLLKEVRSKAAKKRVTLMDKKSYNPKRCVREPLYLTDEQKARFLNNQRSFFGKSVDKYPKAFFDCLSLLDFEQRCLSCHYDLVKKDSFALRGYSDGEMCLTDFFDALAGDNSKMAQGKMQKTMYMDSKKNAYDDIKRERRDSIKEMSSRAAQTAPPQP